MSKVICIYKIKSLSKPERFYIGSSVNYIARKSRHIRDLEANKHHCRILQRHVNRYGIKDLMFEILEPCNVDMIIQREQFYIDTLKPMFNTLKIAGSAFVDYANFKGKKHSPQTLAKMRGRKCSPEAIERMRIAALNRSEEHKRKMSESQKKKRATDATKEKMRISKLGNTIRNGKKDTEEQKKNRSIAMIGNTRRADYLKKINKL